MEWHWTEWPENKGSSVYFTRAFNDLFAKKVGAKSACLAGRTLRGKVVYLPVLLKDVGEGRQEAHSSYGYGGCLGTEKLAVTGVDKLSRFLAKEGIIDLFLRHAPFLENHALWPSSLVTLDRWTYAAALRPVGDFERLVSSLPQKLRWSVGYATRAGLKTKFTTRPTKHEIEEFYSLYQSLMTAKSASKNYMFTEEFFASHFGLAELCCELAMIRCPRTEQLLAGAMFFCEKGSWAHYHLSAANEAGRRLQIMELMLVQAMHRYGQNGHTWLHLGGGHKLDESDGLSRFKAKLGNRRLPYYITRLVCDTDAYDEERRRLPLINPSMFLVNDARGA